MPGDIELGSDTTWWGPNLTAYVDNGTIPESRLTDMAERIIAGWYLLGQDSGYPDTNFNSWISFLGSNVNVQADHASYVGPLLASVLAPPTSHTSLR